MEHIKQFPHCDPRVLHKPGQCECCDNHPDWQELRQAWSIAFTGDKPVELENTDGPHLPCPADFARGDSHQLWHGNRATSEQDKPIPSIWVRIDIMNVVDEVKEADVLRTLVNGPASLVDNYRYVPVALYNDYIRAVASRNTAVTQMRRFPKPRLTLTSALHEKP